MGRLRKSIASDYLSNAYVKQYVEATGMNGGSGEAKKARNLPKDEARETLE